MYNDHVQHKLFHRFLDRVQYVVRVDHDQIQAKIKCSLLHVNLFRELFIDTNTKQIKYLSF